MQPPQPTPIFRIVHLDNLPVILHRGGIHAPSFFPDDGLHYRTIHNVEIQSVRQRRPLNCGPRGVVHDYVPFYFGPRSPMLLQLHTGRVAGYDEGQKPVIYLVSNAQTVQQKGLGFVFSDGHGIACFTRWFDNLAGLNELDWECIYADYWSDNVNDMDRQRKKQAEFLVHRFFDWSLVSEIGVIDDRTKSRVESVLERFPAEMHRPVNIRQAWYY